MGPFSAADGSYDQPRRIDDRLLNNPMGKNLLSAEKMKNFPFWLV